MKKCDEERVNDEFRLKKIPCDAVEDEGEITANEVTGMMYRRIKATVQSC